MAKKLFDFAIGNPPYQESQEATSDKPVYNYLMDAAYEVSDKAEFITPARFLFNAGKTPKAWNEKMLNDPHFKVLNYEKDAAKIFPNTDIKGGVAITYRDSNSEFGRIGVFTKYNELNRIVAKVHARNNYRPLTDIIYQQNKFNLPVLYKDYPEYKSIIGSKGTEKRLTTPIFAQLGVFKANKSNEEELSVYGLIKNVRYTKYINRKYIEEAPFIDKYKVITPASGGKGEFGETLSNPIVISPEDGFTQSFIGIGVFDIEEYAQNVLKYIKTKFARALLGVLKVTQHAHKEVWKMIPLQDFSDKSDIDWSKSVHEIDLQLYRKYGLSSEEIDFIETNVKEMI